jgi:hypothetical protein
MPISELLREKTPGLIDELERADPRLKTLVYFAAAFSLDRFGIIPILTRVNGTRAETIAHHGAGAPISPHEVTPCRAADLRTRGLLSDPEAQEWEDELDQRFEYQGAAGIHSCATFETQAKAIATGRDPKLPPIVPHLHVQVPPWTALAFAGMPRVRLWSG